MNYPQIVIPSRSRLPVAYRCWKFNLSCSCLSPHLRLSILAEGRGGENCEDFSFKMTARRQQVIETEMDHQVLS